MRATRWQTKERMDWSSTTTCCSWTSRSERPGGLAVRCMPPLYVELCPRASASDFALRCVYDAVQA
eukprot:3744099-Pyramimonas_sp.AAC.1